MSCTKIRADKLPHTNEAYIVEMNDWTEKLRREVANDVRVTGIVSRDAARGHNRIVVTGYEVLSLDDSHAADFGSEFDEYS